MPAAKQSAKMWLTRVITVVFYTSLVVFLFFYVKSLDLSTLSDLQFNLQFVIVASVLGLAMRYSQTLNWLVILHGLGAKELGHNWAALVYVYAKSWLGRYIPGTAPWILGKIYFASRLGVPKGMLAVSSFLEALLQITVILALSSVLLMLDERFLVINETLRLLMGMALAVCFIVLLPPVFNRLLSLAFMIVKKKKLSSENYVTAPLLTRGVLLYMAGGLLYGVSIFFMAKTVYPQLEYDNLLFIAGASNLAGVMGMLAIFLPSGIGVREGIQLIVLSLIMPPEIALAITVLTRLWDVALDLVFFGLSWLLRQFKTPHAG